MSGSMLTLLRRIPTPKGDVLQGLKASEPGFAGFGEAYFTQVHHQAIKGWKRHRQMTLNLICVQGAVRLVVYDENKRLQCDVTLSPDHAETYQRLSVAPGYWVGFEGVGTGTNMLLNLASLVHDQDESEAVSLDALPWPVLDACA